jgi:hypothetical protein
MWQTSVVCGASASRSATATHCIHYTTLQTPAAAFSNNTVLKSTQQKYTEDGHQLYNVDLSYCNKYDLILPNQGKITWYIKNEIHYNVQLNLN